MQIRVIDKKDFSIVDKLIRKSFEHTEHGYDNESELVDKIRTSNEYIPKLEMVAVDDNGSIVGHGLLSEVSVVGSNNVSHVGLVLAPLDVAIDHQNKGIGSKILITLEKEAKRMRYRFISILGHPNYYPRFGYVPAIEYDVHAPFDVPNEAFMIKPLYDNALDSISGTVKYSKAFEE
ncbi:GNAT family N-acetyltransferase [Pediococcus pentosaceus]|uniref:GNAT family N-acetyltransferase n=1 Tax=Pediococcus pentosaceus TaxID=1255 RepID=UPI002017E5B0|nr:N-acetyltransferase [Pediococcus pentosaceus]MCL3857946.1 N-acetyltransferase [Pediococcus pentosaceus]